MKKALSILFVLVLLVSLSATAFATDYPELPIDDWSSSYGLSGGEWTVLQWDSGDYRVYFNGTGVPIYFNSSTGSLIVPEGCWWGDTSSDAWGSLSHSNDFHSISVSATGLVVIASDQEEISATDGTVFFSEMEPWEMILQSTTGTIQAVPSSISANILSLLPTGSLILGILLAVSLIYLILRRMSFS